ncbi:MAG: phosphopantothenoylcysteine decarboxylase [Elusimicrobiota bacterium]
MNKTTARKPLNVLITAGPTREYVDPVRFISNASSGVTGFELARSAAKNGANVTLISGPVIIKPPEKVRVFFVGTALPMRKAVDKFIKKMDIFISSAAVCDWRPEHFWRRKIKKSSKILRIKLTKNPDILKSAAEKYHLTKTFVGFALETENEIENAKNKLHRKKLDLIVANAPENIGSGLASGFILYPDGKIKEIKKCSKSTFAKIIWKEIKKTHYDKRKKR